MTRGLARRRDIAEKKRVAEERLASASICYIADVKDIKSIKEHAPTCQCCRRVIMINGDRGGIKSGF
jgi:hypothetical protein